MKPSREPELLNQHTHKEYYHEHLWYIFGVGYDLSPFLATHPGGTDALLLGKGRDCTNIVRTYHDQSPVDMIKLLNKYRTSHRYDPFSDYINGPIADEPFHADLKAYMKLYRCENGSTSIRPSAALFALITSITTWVLLFYLFRGSYIAALLAPIIAWFPACVLSHDAVHFACCSSHVLNRILSWTCSPLYYNSCIWRMQHVYAHHQFTNDPARDVDLHHAFGWVRMTSKQPLQSFMVYSVYPFLLFAQLLFSTMAESIFYPTVTIVGYCFGTSYMFAPVPNKNNLVRHHFWELVFQLVLSMTIVVAPFLNAQYSLARKFVLGILPFNISSVLFVLATQFAHLTIDTTSAVKQGRDSDYSQSAAFARLQVAASMDVKPESRFLNLVMGGLNTQSLHHVLPKVHNSHFVDMYPEFVKICEKHRVKRCTHHSIITGFCTYIRDIITLNMMGDTKEREEFSIDELSRKKDVIVINGAVYNIAKFKDQHPGGSVISTLNGLDVTNIFYSTHRGRMKLVEPRLDPLKIGTVSRSTTENSSVPVSKLSALPESDVFLCELNERLSRTIMPKASDGEAKKGQIVRLRTLAAWLLGYLLMFILPGVSSTVRILGAVVAALCSCSLVGQIAHEETHGTLKFNGRRLPAFVVSTLWATLWPFMSEPYFRFEHTTHHVDPLNPDFDYEVTGLSYFIRYSAKQPWYPWHALQHLYGIWIYGFYIIFQTIFEFPLGFFRNFNRKYEQQLLHYYNWSISLIVFYVIPRKMGAVAGQRHFWLFICFLYVWQLSLYLIAAINHAIDIKPDILEEYKDVWSYSVLRNTSNFCIDSPFWHWLSGGFNIQNEHHLLTWIPQEYLRQTVDITRQLCKEYNYPYNEFTCFWDLIGSHYRALRNRGRRPSSL